jgi:hypothetical protein
MFSSQIVYSFESDVVEVGKEFDVDVVAGVCAKFVGQDVGVVKEVHRGVFQAYLGRDVLTDSSGSLLPVQWSSFIQGIGRYQGEISAKRDIHSNFRAKVAKCRADHRQLQYTDWSGLR